MYCLNCGAPLGNNEKFCNVCGAAVDSSEMPGAETRVPVSDYEETGRLYQDNINTGYKNIHGDMQYQNRQPDVQTPPQNYTDPNNQQLDENAFYKKYASKGTNGWLVTLIAICFFTGATTIVSVIEGKLFGLFDLVYIVIGVLLILRKKWYFPLAATVYSGVWTIVAVVTSGVPTGLLALAAGTISTIKLKKINDAYKQYKEHGILPQNVI